MNKLIKFVLPDSSPEAVCCDGQVPEAEQWLLPPADSTDPSNPSSGSADDSYLVPALGEFVGKFPTNAKILGTHRHVGTDDFNVIFTLPSGLYFLKFNAKSKNFSVAVEIPLASAVSPDRLVIADSCDRWIVFIHREENSVGDLPAGEVLYSVWKPDDSLPGGGRYSIPAGLPESSYVDYSFADTTLEGYVGVAGNYPTIEISVDCPSSIATSVHDWLIGAGSIGEEFYSSAFEKVRSDINAALCEEWQLYVSSCQGSDKHLFPFNVHAAWEVEARGCSRKFILSPSASRLLLEDFSSVDIRIDDFSIANGNLLLKVLFSRKPQQLIIKTSSVVLPDYLNGEFGYVANQKLIIDKYIDIFTDDSGELSIGPLHSVSTGSERGRGWTLQPNLHKILQLKSQEVPAHIKENFQAAGGINYNSRMILYNSEEIRVSEEKFPPLMQSSSSFEGQELISIVASMRALSSGQFGEFPLYAFCRDGIRALTATEEGGFRSVQLISRDLLLKDTHPVSTANSVVFSTLRGVVELNGSRTEVILAPESHRDLPLVRAWHYPTESIIADYGQSAISLSEDGKKNLPLTIPRGTEYFGEWPLLFAMIGSSVFQVLLSEYVEEEITARSGEILPTLTTRPFKFGSAMKTKVLRYLSLTPDGKVGGWIIEGSNDLHRWHILGCNEAGRPIGPMRGSGWRFFRLIMRDVKTLPGGVFVVYY
ncbi:MAG: hypothetical protein NC036_03280 [Muribaculaceae bacterium]|nr:hypothetical protein [Muribaculaceae bacterium]